VIIDAHAHVHDPAGAHLQLLDEAGIDRSVLFTTRVHPERAVDFPALKAELQALQERLAGGGPGPESFLAALDEQARVLEAHPHRFIGMGSVPLGLPEDEIRTWIAEQVLGRGLRGVGELTPPPGRFQVLAPVLDASAEMGRFPVMVHGFAPTTRDDLRLLAELARARPDVPVVITQLGGLCWMDAIDAAVATPNLFIEISTVPVAFAARHAIAALPDRTLFGSDAPYGDPLLARQLIERVVPPGSLREQVLGGTAARLFGLE
jgi:predicted TIM-barrel fold metal-dependent hydrolase